MDEVARDAGVSRATVSRVLTGQVPVNSDTRERVMAAVGKLGYVPNFAAQNLAKDHSAPVIGMLLRDPRKSAYGLLHSTLQAACEDAGMELVAISPVTRGGVADEYSPLQTLLSLGVNGVFLATGSVEPVEIEVFLDRVPMITVGRPEMNDRISAVSYDEHATGTMLADAVIGSRHRHVAVVVPDPTVSVPEHRRGESISRRLRSAGVEVTEVPVTIDDHPTKSPTAVMHLVQNQRVTAAMFPTDSRAFTFMQMCGNHGVRIPEDVSVTGADGTTPELDYVGLTTVRIPVEAVASRAATMMQGRLLDPGRPIQHESFKGSLVTGTSLDVPHRSPTSLGTVMRGESAAPAGPVPR